jgi:hypothetical protein
VVKIRSIADSVLCSPTASFSSVRERCGAFAYAKVNFEEFEPAWAFGSRMMNDRTGINRNANDPTADPQAAAAKAQILPIHALGAVPAEAWRLYARLYNHS